MSDWAEILLLAVASAFWPTLIVIVVLALRLEHPIKILTWFLAGGLLATITIGIVVVFALEGTSFVSGSSPPADPALDLIAGVLSLGAAFALHRREPRAAKQVDPQKPAKPSVAERAVGGGALVAFVAGIVLDIVPGTFPIVGLKDIAQLDASDAAKVATVVVFYLIMFVFVEIPIVAYLLAPERTTTVMNDLNAWLRRNAGRIAVWVLAAGGLYLVVRGLIELLT